MSLGPMTNFYTFRSGEIDLTIWSGDGEFVLSYPNSAVGRYTTVEEAVSAASEAIKFDGHEDDVVKQAADLTNWSTGMQPEKGKR